MSKIVGSRKEMILPDELDKIESIFHELLQELHLSAESEQAVTLAARLISVYRSGIQDTQALKHLMKTY